MFFFQKHKVLVYRGTNLFFSKIKCPLNCPFSKTDTISFALKRALVSESSFIAWCFKWGGQGGGGTFLSGGGQSGGGTCPPTQTYAPHLKPLCFLVCVGGGMVFLTFKWGAGWGGTFLSGGGRVGGAHAPPTQTYAPLKSLCFLVCVWVRLMWKSGGGQSGGGGNLGGKWGGASGVPPPLLSAPPT